MRGKLFKHWLGTVAEECKTDLLLAQDRAGA